MVTWGLQSTLQKTCLLARNEHVDFKLSHVRYCSTFPGNSGDKKKVDLETKGTPSFSLSLAPLSGKFSVEIGDALEQWGVGRCVSTASSPTVTRNLRRCYLGNGITVPRSSSATKIENKPALPTTTLNFHSVY